MNDKAKIIVAAVCLTAGAALVVGYMLTRPPDGGPVGKAAFVDVTTGEIHYLRQGRDFITIPPGDHPTYYPVEKDDSGAWVLIERYSGGIEEGVRTGALKAEDLKVDLETRKVKEQA